MGRRRTVRKQVTGNPVLEGAGVHLNRVFGFSHEELYDPFLLFDDFRSETPDHYLKGFPWHPHRGIETITYVLQGDVEHGDSLGNKGVISSGDVQWMTAGSGIIHQEMPKGDKDGIMYGFQLWANLPAKEKMMPPRYRDITADQIPEVTLDSGVIIKVIAGMVNGVSGPVADIVIDPEYFDCSIPAHTTFTHSVKETHTVCLYVIDGSCVVEQGGAPRTNGTLTLFSEGDHIIVETTEHSARCLLIAGKPLKEPIAWQGPIVMNSQEELECAFREYREGTFLKHE